MKKYILNEDKLISVVNDFFLQGGQYAIKNIKGQTDKSSYETFIEQSKQLLIDLSKEGFEI